MFIFNILIFQCLSVPSTAGCEGQALQKMQTLNRDTANVQTGPYSIIGPGREVGPPSGQSSVWTFPLCSLNMQHLCILHLFCICSILLLHFFCVFVCLWFCVVYLFAAPAASMDERRNTFFHIRSFLKKTLSGVAKF